MATKDNDRSEFLDALRKGILLGAGILVLVLPPMWLAKRQKFTGQNFAAYAVLYGVTRGIVEAYRGDPSRPMVFGGALSLMQVVSIGLILMGAFLWWRAPHWQQPAAASAKGKRK